MRLPVGDVHCAKAVFHSSAVYRRYNACVEIESRCNSTRNVKVLDDASEQAEKSPTLKLSFRLLERDSVVLAVKRAGIPRGTL